MAEQENKDKPKLLDRLRQKRQERKQRAVEHARRGAKGGGDIRRDTGVTNTGGGPGI